MSKAIPFRTLFLVVLAVIALGCGGAPEDTAVRNRPAVPVQIAVASPEPVHESIEATGTVEAWRRVVPGSKILGRVETVAVREGDRVERGELLARLEQRDLEAAADQARAAVAMAEARLDNARAQHERMKQLKARGSVTDKGLEDASAAFRIASAELQQARATLTAAEVTLGYARIVSPITGWVTRKHVEAGDVAAPGVPLFEIEDLSRVKLVLTVSESQVVGLSPGDDARAHVEVLQRTWEARVDRIIPAGDARSRTFEVQLLLDNPDGRLKSGMFARARFDRGSREALLVPAGALVERGPLRGVFVVDSDGTARLRWVRPGRTLDDRVEVLSGLREGDRFVASPPPGFTDGTPVREG